MNVDQWGTLTSRDDSIKPIWLVLLAVISGLALNFPYVFLYDIVFNEEVCVMKNLSTFNCWEHKSRYVYTLVSHLI